MTEEEQWARRFASQLEDDNTYSEDEYDTDISLSSPLRISGDDDVYTVCKHYLLFYFLTITNDLT